MQTIQIRNVPDSLYSFLKKLCRENHRSLSGEALSILEDAMKRHAAPDLEYNHERLFSSISEVREHIAHTYGTSASSVPLIREDRER